MHKKINLDFFFNINPVLIIYFLFDAEIVFIKKIAIREPQMCLRGEGVSGVWLKTTFLHFFYLDPSLRVFFFGKSVFSQI